MDDLQKSEVVTNLCAEMENLLLINDKGLAELIVELEAKNPTFETFRQALRDNVADFSDTIIYKLRRVIRFKPAQVEIDSTSNKEEEGHL